MGSPFTAAQSNVAIFPGVKSAGKVSNLNIANLLTLIRLIAVPAVVWVLLVPPGQLTKNRLIVAVSIYFWASITDLFDGWIARKYGMVTTLGKLMDPLADKLLVCAAMIMLVPHGFVPAWIAVVVVMREIGVTALRGAASSEGIVIAASDLGKWKTTLMGLGVGGILIHHPYFGVNFMVAGEYLLGAGIVLTAWSGVDYFVRFVGNIIREKRDSARPASPECDKCPRIMVGGGKSC